MKRFWIKLELKYLHDPIMGQMPNYLWRRVIELFMLAGENGDDGLLKNVKDLAWQLHTSVPDMDKSLRTLSELGLVHDTPQGWVVTGFKESQASNSSTQRVQEYRKRIGSASSNKRKRIGEEYTVEKKEVPQEANEETKDVTNDVTEEETEDETEIETTEEPEEENSPSTSVSISNSKSPSFSDSDLLGDEVQEKGAGNAFEVFEANIAMITPVLADALRADIADFSEAWVCDAIKEAVRSNAPNLKYVEAILRRWQIEGRDTHKPTKQVKKRSRQANNQDTEAEDRQKYVSGKYKDWIKH